MDEDTISNFDELQISSNTITIKASTDGASLSYLRSIDQPANGESSFLLIDTTESMGLLDFIENLASQLVIISTNTKSDKLGSIREFLLGKQQRVIAVGDADKAYSVMKLAEHEECDWNVAITWLAHLQVLDWGPGNQFTILHTPGVSPDGICGNIQLQLIIVCDNSEYRIFVGDLLSNHVQLCSPHSDIEKYLNSLHILKQYSSPDVVYSSSKGTCFTQECLDCLIVLVNGIIQDSIQKVGEADGVLYYWDEVSVDVDCALLRRVRDDGGVDEITAQLMAF
jgi:glyoxylase-like metal-dependent hydrolase (beta-lactamase superfamily II)